MSRVTVEVTVGDWMVSRDYAIAFKRDFPNADEYASVESTPPPNRAKVSVYVCSGCKRARHDWAATHPKDSESYAILHDQWSNQTLERTADRREEQLRVER